ncbi:PREDICTED: selenocysteine lyase-like [Priapulus caudatus]|uniref:Selenocysteine lyase-like n=1 Tax=Priapulus caudatus TaxID=37621 RepID=A0ABM1EQ61_PRICU|nr:PREDICTED: selenocysteine lyase-like [Priapulus caudatus]
MTQVRDQLKDKLRLQFGEAVTFNSEFPAKTRVLPNTCNVSFHGRNRQGYKILGACKRLQASVGAACHSHGSVSKVLLACGIPAEDAINAIRLSVGRATTFRDIDEVIVDLCEALQSIDQHAGS